MSITYQIVGKRVIAHRVKGNPPLTRCGILVQPCVAEDGEMCQGFHYDTGREDVENCGGCAP